MNIQGSKSCPFCKYSAPSRILYGYPTRFDYAPGDVCGGDTLLPDSHSHFCPQCKLTWMADGCLPTFVQFPDECHFCDEQMTDIDKFTYQNEYESWFDQDSTPFMLEHGTFAYDPLPTCSQCRNSIHANQNALKNDELKEDVERLWSQRIAIAFCVVMTIAWLVAYFLAL